MTKDGLHILTTGIIGSGTFWATGAAAPDDEGPAVGDTLPSPGIIYPGFKLS